MNVARPERLREVVIARSLCRVRPLSLRDLPPNERDAALRMQALAWQPFPEAQVVTGRLGARGIALGWDRAAAQAALRAAGCDEERVELIPEILLQPQHAEGLHVVRGLDGVEAVRWSDGMPVASRWWPEAPGDADWLEFLRLAGPAAAGTSCPTLEGVPQVTLRAKPWLRCVALGEDAQGMRPIERIALAAAAISLLGVTSALGHQAWELHSRQAAQLHEVQALKLRASPTLAARDKAMALQDEGRALNEAMAGVMPLELLQHLAQRLPAGVTTLEIELVGLLLRLSLNVPASLPHSTLIRELQAGNWLQEVRLLQPGANGKALALEMRLSSDRPPPAPEARPAPAARRAGDIAPASPASAALPGNRPPPTQASFPQAPAGPGPSSNRPVLTQAPPPMAPASEALSSDRPPPTENARAATAERRPRKLPPEGGGAAPPAGAPPSR